jgi:hypothetical protein
MATTTFGQPINLRRKEQTSMLYWGFALALFIVLAISVANWNAMQSTLHIPADKSLPADMVLIPPTPMALHPAIPFTAPAPAVYSTPIRQAPSMDDNAPLTRRLPANDPLLSPGGSDTRGTDNP